MKNIKNFFAQAQLSGFRITETSLTKKEHGFTSPAPLPDFVEQDFIVTLTRNWGDTEEVVTLRKDKKGLRFDNMPTVSSTSTVDGKKKKTTKAMTMEQFDNAIEDKTLEEILAMLEK
jgi:hypothetical protein